MDSHGARPDGFRIRRGALRALPAADRGHAEGFPGAVLRAVAMVRHRSDRSRGSSECFRRMAPCAIRKGVGARRSLALSSIDAGRRDSFFLALVGLAMAIYLISVRGPTR